MVGYTAGMPAPSSDPLDIMLAHDAWATRLMLEACRPLTHEQFHRRFDMGPGSLHDTLTHTVSATRRWTDRLASRPVRAALMAIPGRPDPTADVTQRSADELLALHAAAASDLQDVVKSLRAGIGLASTLTFDWGGNDGRTKRYTFTRGCVLVHVCSHAMHHRAQCLNMLRHLNVPGVSDKLPDSSAVDWQAQTEIPAVVLAG